MGIASDDLEHGRVCRQIDALEERLRVGEEMMASLEQPVDLVAWLAERGVSAESPDQTLRIEALRAAAQLVSGSLAGGVKIGERRLSLDDDDAVLDIADKFVRWLETGER